MNATLMLGLALVVSAPIKDPPKKDEPSIVGEWFAQSGVAAGVPLPPPKEALKFTFTKDGKLLIKEGTKGDEGKYKSDATKKPAELDLIPPEDKPKPTLSAIYKLEDDKLIICMLRDGSGKRPTSFESTKDNGYMLLTFTRAKKE